MRKFDIYSRIVKYYWLKWKENKFKSCYTFLINFLIFLKAKYEENIDNLFETSAEDLRYLDFLLNLLLTNWLYVNIYWEI